MILTATLISVAIGVAFTIGVAFAAHALQKDVHAGGFLGLMCSFIPIFAFLDSFVHFESGIYNSIPYRDTPEVVYELDTDSIVPVYQTGEENSITFFTADGKAHTETYAEMERCKDGKNCIEVYERDDKGFWWMSFTPQRKVVIHTEEGD